MQFVDANCTYTAERCILDVQVGLPCYAIACACMAQRSRIRLRLRHCIRALFLSIIFPFIHVLNMYNRERERKRNTVVGNYDI